VPRSLQDVALAIKRVQNRHHRMLDTQLTPLGLSLVQWDALRHLDRNPQASLHDLAQLIFQSDQAFGTLSARMAERGLVERTPGPGRAVRLVMTDKGRELLTRGSGVVDAVLRQSMASLEPHQLDQLCELLEQLTAEDSTLGTAGATAQPVTADRR
jgi:DNA-binding MarR family transcriptional regulator